MPLVKARTKDLLEEGREMTLLNAAFDAGSTAITVEDNGDIAENDLLVVGQLGSEGTEIVKVTAAVTYGQALTVAGMSSIVAGVPTYSGGTIFAHPVGTQVYRIDYDQVYFYWAATPTGSKTQLSIDVVDADSVYTTYSDVSNSTGYAFFRFHNSITLSFSSYSDAVSYGGYTTGR